MGRKKNLEVLKARLAHVEREIKELEAYQAGDLYQLNDFEDERDALVWVLRKLEAEGEIGIGDRVKLAVVDDPDGEEGHQPEQGIVLGRTGSGDWLIRPLTGEYSGTKTGLWYGKESVELLDE